MCFYTPQYEATAMLRIEDAKPFLAYSESDTGIQSQHYVREQEELLRSPLVLEPVLSYREIAKLPELSKQGDPVEYLRERITISQESGSELYTIAFRSPSPSAAASVVNAVLEEYFKTQDVEENSRLKRVLRLLDEECRARQLDVERLRNPALELSIEVTGKDPFGHDVLLNLDNDPLRLVNLREKLLEVDLDRETLLAEIALPETACDRCRGTRQRVDGPGFASCRFSRDFSVASGQRRERVASEAD